MARMHVQDLQIAVLGRLQLTVHIPIGQTREHCMVAVAKRARSWMAHHVQYVQPDRTVVLRGRHRVPHAKVA